MFGVAVLITGCSGNFNVNSNPDEENFDDNYQGSPEINQENSEIIDQTGTGEILNEEENIEQTGTETGEVVIEPAILEGTFENEAILEVNEETGTGEILETDVSLQVETPEV